MKVEYLENHIGIYSDVVNVEDCNKIIQHYEKVKESNLTINRQQYNNSSLKIKKDNENYFLSQTSIFANDNVDYLISKNDKWIFDKFKQAISECYLHYSSEYGILETVARHGLSGGVKIQKTLPSQGYHVWHCEHDCLNNGNRLLLAILYLNDVEDGGETEFLYQRIRVKPNVGKLIICPSGFTHTHRGNPPLTSEKYIINTWIEFTE